MPGDLCSTGRTGHSTLKYLVYLLVEFERGRVAMYRVMAKGTLRTGRTGPFLIFL